MTKNFSQGLNGEKMTQNIDIESNNNEAKNVFYTVAMRGMVAFPKMVMHFDIARPKSAEAVERSLRAGSKLFLITQKEASVDDPSESELYNIGVVAEIRQVLKMPDNNVMKVLVEGLYRASMTELYDDGTCLQAKVKKMSLYSRAKADKVEIEALMRSVKDVYERYISYFPRMPKGLLTSILCEESPIKLFEEVTFNFTLDYKDKQLLLE